MQRSAVVWCLTAALSAIATGLSGCGAVPEKGGLPAGPHPMIIVAVDGLRADALGCYGDEQAGTPAFDELAAESVRFQWAFAQAGDPAVSFAAVLDGMYPTTSGVRTASDRLPDDATTLAEALATSGLERVAFVDDGSGADAGGLDQGFTEYRRGGEPGFEASTWLKQHAGDDFLLVLRGWRVRSPLADQETAETPAPPSGYAERVERLLASAAGDDAPALEPEDMAYIRERYADRVRAVDARLGELMGELRSDGLAERATVVVLGTNGCDLLRHGVAGRDGLHATVTRVPLLVRFPGGANVATVDRIVELVDVMPTALELEGATIPSPVQGRSLLPLLRGEGTPPYRAFSETPTRGGQVAMALGGYRLLAGGDVPPELYNLAADPLEMEDIADADQDRVGVMERQIEAWRQMVAAASLDPDLRSEKPLDDATLERLKSLGYVH